MGKAKTQRASGYAPDRKRPLDLFEWARLPLPDAPRKLAHAHFPSRTKGPQPAAQNGRPAHPHRRVSVERPIRLADSAYRKVVRPSPQRPVHFDHQRRGNSLSCAVKDTGWKLKLVSTGSVAVP